MIESRSIPELTILMPCLNEAETVGVCVSKAQSFLSKHDVSGEVLVADNGSVDGSPEIAKASRARVIEVEERGYGSALLAGIKEAVSPFIIMGDADDSYDFTKLMPFLEKLREGNDLVMGNRFQGGIERGAMPFLHRYLGNPVLSRLGRIFFKSTVGDFHCGLRGFRKEAIDSLDLRTMGMEFASEMIVKATLFNKKVVEVPTILAPAGRSRAPHLRTWQDGWRHLRFLLLFSPRWLFLYPGLVLMLAGLFVGFFLLLGPITIGSVIFDIHTLLFAAMAIVLGFQSVLFALFTKVFAIREGLLPEDPRLNQAFKYITLETGLVIGVVLLFLGLSLSVYLYFWWGSVDFGPLQPSVTFRWAIPAVLLTILGFQIVLQSFFLSVLGLKPQR